jgi:hypothetical protein
MYISKEYFDTVIFFKDGNVAVYLYHMDSFIGINNLHLTAMLGTYCYGGFPEIAYGKYFDMILNKPKPLK